MKLSYPSDVYEPREDSYLTLEGVLEFKSLISESGGAVEVGVGSGYVLLHLAEELERGQFLGTDINFQAALQSSKNAETNHVDVQIVCAKNLQCFRRDGTPKVVIFNPPYLPEDEELDQLLSANEIVALVGGKKGTETLTEFVEEMPRDLTGFFVISSLATSFDEFVKELRQWRVEMIKEERLSFETLWLVKVRRE